MAPTPCTDDCRYLIDGEALRVYEVLKREDHRFLIRFVAYNEDVGSWNRIQPEPIWRDRQKLAQSTLLLYAAEKGDDLSLFKECLSPHTVRCRNIHGLTALHEIIAHFRTEYLFAVFEVLAPEDLSDIVSSPFNQTLLHLACITFASQGSIIGVSWGLWEQLILRLMMHGMDVNAIDADKRTALYYAARNNRPRLVEMLLVLGADPRIVDVNNETAFSVASRLNLQEVTAVLYEFSAAIVVSPAKRRLSQRLSSGDAEVELLANG
eukprot:CAMPEP_0184660780 /NCGR_PEP_ID=MMETSP0308-20130426/35256_1 /TAXON_ID=38269 /ORGANISM="Gloeochaete witrockiana, Strain SAG 46.84" /LENGTH=264 /DNA_ID=CAMNT_0027101621 /DNA_START=1 /DNA_END=795 /DNA_ORIENTATION=+